MALKQQFPMTSLFSMASMTDVIFLLLIFFMVTSTIVFPTALEVNLPQSSEQTALKPTTQVVVYADGSMSVVTPTDPKPVKVDADQLQAVLLLDRQQSAEPRVIAIYADEAVTYGDIVKILDMGARNSLNMVLATKPAPASARM
ncbi:MAG: biopolymer transporter ExbD [Paramuribaculum sp.]|nr:biopolymer transporter ExbD [Paramuribaculum sp.]